MADVADGTDGTNRGGRLHLPGLTGARFIAALWVVIYHLWRWDSWTVPGPIHDVVAGGPVAVSFFFVLSGFVLTLSAMPAGDGTSDDISDTMTTSALSFWRGRLRRLLPVALVAFVIALPTAIAIAKRGGGDAGVVVFDAIVSITMLQAWIPGHELAINPPAWSLSVEVAMSLLFPLLAPPLVRFARRSTTMTLTALAALWALSTVPGLLYAATDPDSLRHLGIAVDHRAHAVLLDVLRYHPLVRLPEFLIGVVTCVWWRRGLRLPMWSAGAAAVVVACALVIGVPAVVSHNGLFSPAWVVITLALASSPTALAQAPLQVLGNASYALYLLHVPLLYWVAGISQRRTGANVLERPLPAAIVVVVVVVVAVVVHRLVERPRRRR